MTDYYGRPVQDYYYEQPRLTPEVSQSSGYSTIVIVILVALFITVCVCVYGGVQSILPTRRLGDVKISKDLTVEGTTNIKGKTIGVPSNRGIKDINNPTKGHSTHTIKPDDPDTIIISCSLEPDSILKLYNATGENIGTHKKVLFQESPGACVKVVVSETSSTEFVGSTNVTRSNATDGAANATVNTVNVIAKDGEEVKGIEIDADSVSNGGASGSWWDLIWAAKDKIYFYGQSYVEKNTDDITGEKLFTTNGFVHDEL